MSYFALLAALLVACGPQGPKREEKGGDPVARATGLGVDTLGVVDLAEGDTLNQDAGLTIIETTRSFPRRAEGGEVFAWEFYARSLSPVKLIVVRWREGRELMELTGESELVVPRQLGPNRFSLREPIPVHFHDLFGIVQPEEGVVPFKKILNWKTLIAVTALQRPFMRRDHFSMYGWRYAVRVFWRHDDEAGL